MDSLSDIMLQIKMFCSVRDWDQFHNPKDLSIGLSTEANELLDLFRFKSEEDMRTMLMDQEKRKQIGQELADVFFFLLRFAQLYDFDLLQEMKEKMFINDNKYPIESARGSNLKYNEKRL